MGGNKRRKTTKEVMKEERYGKKEGRKEDKEGRKGEDMEIRIGYGGRREKAEERQRKGEKRGEKAGFGEN